MKKDRWIEQLHDKLAEHEEAAPEGLWADIEAALPAPRRSRFMALRRWAAAAAAAVLVIGGGYVWWLGGDQSVEQHEEEQMLTQAQTYSRASGDEPVALHAEKERGTAAREGAGVAKTEEAGGKEVHQAGSSEAEQTGKPSETLTGEQTTGQMTGQTGKPSETLMAGHTAGQTTGQTTGQTGKPSETLTVGKPSETLMTGQARGLTTGTAKKGTMSVGLYAMNGFNGENSSNGVLMADAMAKQFHDLYDKSQATAARSSEPIYLTGYEEREHHHRPVSYGLTLSYPTTERLSVTTGVVYTKLVSDFTQVMRGTQIQREQTLHYVGIPVGLNYRLWAQKGFRAYLSAGIMAYWNVKTHVVTEGVTQEMEKDRVQLALNASLGLQYDIIPQLGLYVEPGLSYYPDNESHIQNFFKEKPTNLSLQVGLRINIDR